MNPTQILEVRPGHRQVTGSPRPALAVAQELAAREPATTLFQVGVGTYLVAQTLSLEGTLRPLPDTLKRHWLVTSR